MEAKPKKKKAAPRANAKAARLAKQIAKLCDAAGFALIAVPGIEPSGRVVARIDIVPSQKG